MSTKILAIDLSVKKENIIFDTIEHARKTFLTNPEYKNTMKYTKFQSILENGDICYDRDSGRAYCLDYLLEPETEGEHEYCSE